MPRELVESRNEVLENVRAFNRGLQESERLRDQLPYFRAWYYIPEIDMVGPSKFVGYKGMTVSEYLESYERLDGRETEPALRKLFAEVDPHHGDWKREGRYIQKLVERLLGQYGKVPNKKARFSGPPEWSLDGRGVAPAETDRRRATVPDSDEVGITASGEPRPMVEVFWRAFLTLYPDDQAALAERIENHLRRA